MHHAKHRNRVRISGGMLRGRVVPFDETDGLRPTPESVRQRLFNWLGQDLTGQTVLDMFAGSGALGLEAASRHARRVLLCDNNRAAADRLARLVRQWGLDNVQAACADALVFIRHAPPADVVLLDPPFAWRQWSQLWPLLQSCLREGAMVYVEAGVLPAFPDWLTRYREGRAGQSRFVLLSYAGGSSPNAVKLR